jgi:GAF domain-containing protein
MMTDSLSSAVRTRAKQMGIAALEFKPGLSKLDPVQYQADLQAFARRLLEEVLPGLQEPAAKATPPTAAQLGMAAKPSREESSREIKLLQVHIGELRGLADPAHLPPLVMRVARHFFERAVLFLVKDEEIRGLGGFGPAGQGESLNAVARQILVPLAEPSMFLDVISTGKPFAGEPDPGGWNEAVRSRLGRFRAGTVVLVPLVAHRDTIAVLYGDNPETGRALGRMEALELFMHQAGIAMENALLQKKLRGQAETG